jgi:hypothetical protein
MATESKFAINDGNLIKFLRRHMADPETQVLEKNWNPAEVGNESDIEDLIRCVQDQGLPNAPIVTGPDNKEISFLYVDDGDGGTYQWQVYVRGQNFYLSSMHEEMRRIVHDNITGIAAAAAIVREGVGTANELIRKIIHPEEA